MRLLAVLISRDATIRMLFICLDKLHCNSCRRLACCPMHKPGNRKFMKIDFFRFLDVYQPSGAIGDVGMASFMRKMITFLSKKASFF